MTPTEQITPELERVVDAIWSAEWEWPFADSTRREAALTIARAALQALLPVGEGTLSMEMLHAMDIATDFQWSDIGLSDAFTAAIQHIIGEKGDA